MRQVWTSIPPPGSCRRHKTMEKHVAVDLRNKKVRHNVLNVVLSFFLEGGAVVPVWVCSLELESAALSPKTPM